MVITKHPHLISQARDKGIDIAVIDEVLANPAITYKSFTKDRATGQRVPVLCRECGTQQDKWTGTASDGTKVCIAVNACCGLAVTVFLDQVETAIRPDQRAKGVTGYRGRDGQWRN
jgi:hypothetical protein